ncbi:glutamate ABC transporter substrate-binding protein [Nocardia sp. 004]|uniref:glutamate ABC transporter substrate-binding protein n=1 Tax=Nocardia sp. 004 TaxID=3385978 RepID=UPI00399FD29F
MPGSPLTIVPMVLMALTLALASGCSTTPANQPSAIPDYTAPPLPANAVLIPPDAPILAPDTTSCGDPTASLRPSEAGTAARGPTLDAIRARGRLLVGLDTGSNLFSFRDPVTGVISGFDADIAREIAHDLLGDPNLIEFRTLGSTDRTIALQEHTVDVVAKTMTITCQRREKIDFSTVYLYANQHVLTVRDSGIHSVADLAGKRVCAVAGTVSLEYLRLAQPAAAILTVPTWDDCLVVLQQRQVDAVGTEEPLLAGLAAQDPYTELVGDSISKEFYGIGIPKGEDDLVRFVNGTLERIRDDGTWTRLYQQYLTELGPTPTPPSPTYRD